MNTSEPPAPVNSVRKLIWISGTVLWVFVAIVGYRAWNSSRLDSQDTAANVDSGNIPPDAIPEHEDSESAETTADGAHEGAAVTVSMTWDPAGIQDFSLTERSGRTVTKADLLGKPWAVCFTFSRCAGPCPIVMGQMYQLQKRVEELDVKLVTVTVQPEVDTPDQLNKWAESVAADPDRWLFLTGNKQAIYDLVQKSFKMPVQEVAAASGSTVIHTNNVMLVNGQGCVIGKFNGVKPEEMADLRKALAREAASEATGESREPTDDAGEAGGDQESPEPESTAPEQAKEER